MSRLGTIALVFVAMAARAEVSGCACDPAEPASLSARECGLTREALRQPEGTEVFFLKDINPRKPNRWLALPRHAAKGVYRLSDMTPGKRTALWTAAISKAKEMWGDEWGVAINGDRVRTQCQVHIHLGKFVRGAEADNFITVGSVGEIPVPETEGLWVHPVGDGKMHVHTGEILTETILSR